MSGPAEFPPDITLAVDGEGVIRTAVFAEALADESLDQWRACGGRTPSLPTAAEQMAKAVESGSAGGGVLVLHVNQRLPSGRELTAGIHNRQARLKGRLHRHRQECSGRSRTSSPGWPCPEGARTGLLEASRGRNSISRTARRFAGGGRAGAGRQFAGRRGQRGGDEDPRSRPRAPNSFPIWRIETARPLDASSRRPAQGTGARASCSISGRGVLELAGVDPDQRGRGVLSVSDGAAS